ncbi:MBL fold metallo-hydrolase [Tolumonas osonensis]|uniref:L-ascorbate metabolism protein UlaG (Beta-lactamase superfamily) n=1 Tax=Tolumonas osonensis TaxID=675874 RepID=A0A841GNQ6_9GAMM|nr:MBL fold metallo-hydrolase [Tolumonas osonensis]MBB6056925.1 L-ascorbate metabolism protein UlaG (beta-lactamase superfamily) [Tolumonas osonensis]
MRYTNQDGSQRSFPLKHVLRRQTGWHGERQPRSGRTGIPVPVVHNDGADLHQYQHDTLTWIGHSSFLLQLGGLNMLIDPVMSSSLGGVVPRNVAPGLSWSALPKKIDVVMITHNHRDHMDVPTLKKLGPHPLYLVPHGMRHWFLKNGFPQVQELEWWQQTQVGNAIMTFVPAQHWSRRGLMDMNTSWWGGFVMEHDGFRLYHAGDTAWFEGFRDIGRRCGPIDVAMLPIGAYAPRWFMRHQHMDPDDALKAFVALEAKLFVAMHWGTFKLTDEPLNEPPIRLRDLWHKLQLPQGRLAIPAIGQTLEFPRLDLSMALSAE